MTSKVLNHLSIIMDGNSRWAHSMGLSALEGHCEGMQVAIKSVDYALKYGIKNLSLYALSIENLGRPKEEINWLIDLLKSQIHSQKDNLESKNIRLKVIGSIDMLPNELVSDINKIVEETSKNTNLNLYIAFCYGGRNEIIDAYRAIIKDCLNPDELTELKFRTYLYAKEMPDVDLVIRTGGDVRISNFLLWHSSYAELFFLEKYWPDFSEEDFLNAINTYSSRKRTFGLR